MISMTKNEIAKYLRDYAILCELMREHPSTKIGDVFKYYMIGSNRIDELNDDYFIRMIRVYGLITELRMFSFREDLSIDYLNDNELDFDSIKENIFVNSKDAKCFSKKQIIRFIRDAFNHSDKDKQLYSLSVNGRYLEVYLKDTKPIPFHIKLNYDQLNFINTETIEKSHNMLMSTIDLDDFDFTNPNSKSEISKIKFIHFYFGKKFDSTIINKLCDTDYSQFTTTAEVIKKGQEILKDYGCVDYSIKAFPLKEEQIDKVYEILSNLHNIDFTKFKFEDIAKYKSKFLKLIVGNVVRDVIPLGMYHNDQLEFEQRFAAWFMSDPNLSYNEILNKLNNITLGKKYEPICTNSEEYNNFDKERHDALKKFFQVDDGVIPVRTIQLFKDYNTRIMYPISLYLGFIADSLVDGETINVEGTDYNSKHIRNSFVHGRWFIGEQGKIELYDCPNGNNNDYNFNWHESINLKSLLVSMDIAHDRNKPLNR